MRRRAFVAALVAAAACLGAGATPAAAQRSGLQCERCHGELELLRQHVESLDSARALLVPRSEIGPSAHGALGCPECHTGFDRFPHPTQTATRSCASCHAEQEAAWERGVHATVGDQEVVGCFDCHGVHDVAPAAALETGDALATMNDRCATCHETQRLPDGDPHADRVSCAACHAPHAIESPDRPGSWMARRNQPRVCGTCHDSVATRWSDDVHGQGLLGGQSQNAGERAGEAPTCSSCHGAHPITRAMNRQFDESEVERCIECHERAGATYYGSYHGKAARLGSGVAATCSECHGAHEIFPASDPRSTVAEANLVATCRACHDHARPAFVQYDTHPEPLDRERNPAIFFSFVFMNVLLIGTLLVFGLHTLLWWIRTMIDRRRGVIHGGHGHGGGDGE